MDKKLVKSAGEHWVCSMLAQIGWAAALTRDGIARTDLLAVNVSGGQQATIQVKTTMSSNPAKFVLGSKVLDISRSEHEWVVLVALPPSPSDRPISYVVPRVHVAAGAWIRWREWLTNTRVESGSRNTSFGKWRFEDWIFARYRERWDLLDWRSTEVDVMLPHKFRIWAEDKRVGLPSGHPWVSDFPENWDEEKIDPSWPGWALRADWRGDLPQKT